MALSRRGSGPTAALRGFGSQVHPVFMLPPVALSVLGSLLVVAPSPWVGGIHAAAVFFAVYTAHVTDGYVDFHVRGEDDDHPLTPVGCGVALLGATTGFVACVAGLWVLAGPPAALLAIPMWLLGVLHAPVLDTNPVTVTVGYPAGNALALVSAAVAQTGGVPAVIGALALVVFVLLCGVKVVDDAQDYDYDRSVGKRTVVVALGRALGWRVGFGLMGVALLLTLGFAARGVLASGRVFPQSAVFAVFAFGLVAAVAHDRPPEVATMLLVRASYVFLAVLLAAVWFRPMSGPLPVDIGVLGPYTYLATEVVFGAVALVLLARTGTLRAAARTIAVIYPVAYLWDWYTLQVGVFAVPLRTGVDLLGIPIEEHLFIVVVPAFVLGVHATLDRRRSGAD